MSQPSLPLYDPQRFAHRPRVAVVDDDAVVRTVLQRSLEFWDLDPVLYENGAEALIGVLENPPDLLLVDKRMPQLDGVSLVRALRDNASTRVVPILLMSATALEADVVGGLEAGADDFLTKPLSLAILRVKVRRFLGRHASATEAPTRLPDTFDLPERLGDYVLEEVIGHGGSGEVFRALHAPTQREVALKLLFAQEGWPLLDGERESLTRFFREIEILGSLKLPNVVPFRDSGYARGRYFFSMDLVRGESAIERLTDQGRWSEQDALRLGLDVSVALEGLAKHGLVHRDLKPGNLLVDTEGRTTLVDFGLAKPVGVSDLTQSDHLMGTAGFLAPEVVRGATENLASDMYSLGVTLYQLLTGELPHAGETPIEILRRVHEGVPAEPLRLHRPGASATIVELVARLMNPDPSERLADPSEARLAFEQALAKA